MLIKKAFFLILGMNFPRLIMEFHSQLRPASVVLIKFLITLGCILQILSLADCHFVHVMVGFVPTNPLWDHPTIDFGLWFYQSYDSNVCQEASSRLETLLIGENDIVWKVSRISSVLACISSGISLLTVIYLDVSPNVSRCFSVLLVIPMLLSSMLAEAAKFIILHSSICLNNVWIPFQTSASEVAQKCILARSAYMSLTSLVSHFISCCIVMVSATSSNVSITNRKDVVFVGNYLEFDKALEDVTLDDAATEATMRLSIPETVESDAITPRTCNYSSSLGKVSSIFLCPNVTHESKTPRTCNSSSQGWGKASSLFFCPYTATATKLPIDEMKRSRISAKNTFIPPMNVAQKGKVSLSDCLRSVPEQQGSSRKSTSLQKKSLDAAVGAKDRNLEQNYGLDAVNLSLSQTVPSAKRTHDPSCDVSKNQIFGPYAVDIPSPRDNIPTDDVMATLTLMNSSMNVRDDELKRKSHP